MEIIYLPGNSLRNKEWIEKVKERFERLAKGEILYYRHWGKGEESILFEDELERLAELIKNKNDYVVFGKSVGVILALEAINRKILMPKKAFFCGFPCSFVKGNRFGVKVGEILSKLSMPTLWLQNEFDKVGGEKEVRQILQKHGLKNYRLVKRPGISTHDYEDYDQLARLAEEFLIYS